MAENKKTQYKGFVIGRVYRDVQRAEYRAVCFRELDEGKIVIVEDPETLRELARWIEEEADAIEEQAKRVGAKA